MRLLLLLLVLATPACLSAEVSTLPAHRLVEGEELGEEPPLFLLDDVDRSRIPAGIPIGVIEVRGDSDTSVKALANRAAQEARSLRAEYVLMERAGHVLELVSGPAPILFPSSTLANRRSAVSVAYRIAPARLGVETNSMNMVLAIDNPDLSAAGLLEGDTLLSVDDALYEPLDLRSPYLGRQFHWRPGMTVDVVWIRPGTGRMEGSAALIENPPVHLELRDHRGRVPVLPFADAEVDEDSGDDEDGDEEGGEA